MILDLFLAAVLVYLGLHMLNVDRHPFWRFTGYCNFLVAIALVYKAFFMS